MSRRTGPSDILRYSHLGIQFALVILAAIWAGRWLDRLVSTRGIFTLVGTFAGAGLGFYLLYRETQRLQSDRSATPQDPDGAHGDDARSRGDRGPSDGPPGGT